MFYQLLSSAGALMILIAYAAQQANRMPTDTIAYQTLNFLGALFLFITGMKLMQAGFILVEGVWTVISLVGLWRAVTRRS